MKGTKKRAAVYLRVSRGVRQRKLRLVETYEESAGAVASPAARRAHARRALVLWSLDDLHPIGIVSPLPTGLKLVRALAGILQRSIGLRSTATTTTLELPIAISPPRPRPSLPLPIAGTLVALAT